MASTLVPNNTVVVPTFGVPSDALFSTPPADGQEAVDETTGLSYIRVKGVWIDQTTALAFASSTGALAATDPTRAGTFTDNATALTDGTLALVGIVLKAGTLVTNVGFYAGATLCVAPTHSWAVLASGPASGPIVLGVSADGLTAVPTVSTALVSALGTPFRIATSGLYYIGLCFKVTTTLPSLMTRSGTAIFNTYPPIYAGTSNAGATVPPALAAVLTTITPTAAALTGFVS